MQGKGERVGEKEALESKPFQQTITTLIPSFVTILIWHPLFHPNSKFTLSRQYYLTHPSILILTDNAQYFHQHNYALGYKTRVINNSFLKHFFFFKFFHFHPGETFWLMELDKMGENGLVRRAFKIMQQFFWRRQNCPSLSLTHTHTNHPSFTNNLCWSFRFIFCLRSTVGSILFQLWISEEQGNISRQKKKGT